MYGNNNNNAVDAATAAAELKMRVELALACRGLPSMDLMSASDPFVVLYERLGARQRPVVPLGALRNSNANGPAASTPLNSPNEWREIGRTEHIDDNNNPTFRTHLVVDYRFEEVQELEFHIFDYNDRSPAVLIGVVRCRMSDLVRRSTSSDSRDIMPADPQTNANRAFGATARALMNSVTTSGSLGKLLIGCEPLNSDSHYVSFTPEGRGLEKMDFFGKSDPYLQVVRNDALNNQAIAHQTETIRKTLDPKWARVRLPVTTVCNGDYDRTLIFRVWDWDSDTRSELIGEFRATLAELTGMHPPNVVPQPAAGRGTTRQFTLIRPLDRRNPAKARGSIVLHDIRIEADYSFLEFVRGGMQIGVMMAIDFTGSNGHPKDATSLHNIDQPNGSPYQRAIEAIGNVVAPYDSDQMFPMWGFGALVRNRVEHCFMLTPEPAVYGVSGMVEAYRQIVPSLTFSGPTYFAPVIQAATATVQQQVNSPTEQSYTILVIITDGIICDMDETIDAIITASTLPLSIIIVGVGDADFTRMSELDSDDGLLKRKGKVAARDIVQFVPFNKYANSPSLLAAETLAEVPTQVEWAKSMGVRPLPPPPTYGF